MPRVLYIVSREQPLLYGYLITFLVKQPEGGDDVEIIIDRRREEAQRDADPAKPLMDRRRHPEIDESIRSLGVAVVRFGPVTRRPARQPRSRLRAGALALVALGAAGALGLAFGYSGRLESIGADLDVRLWSALDHFTQTKRIVRSPEEAPSTPSPTIQRGEQSEAPVAGDSPPAEQAPGGTGPAPAQSRAVEATRQGPRPTVVVPPRPAQKPIVAARSVDSLPSAPAPRGAVTAVVGGVKLAVYRGLPRIAPSSQAQAVSYTVHLSDSAGKPLSGARVSLEGITPEGRALYEPLSPAKQLGTYRGTLSVEGLQPADLRVRVNLGSKRFEIPLPQ
jgi:hypothetical protein